MPQGDADNFGRPGGMTSVVPAADNPFGRLDTQSAASAQGTLVAASTGWLASRGGASFVAVRRTIPAAQIAGNMLRIRLQVSKGGTAAGWGLQVLLGGVILCQWYPGSTQLMVTGEQVVYVDSHLYGSDVTRSPQMLLLGQNPASLSPAANYGNSAIYTAAGSTVSGIAAGDLALELTVTPNGTDDCRVDYLVAEAVPMLYEVPAGAVACWGDSLTLGVGSSVSGRRGTGWADLLRINGQREIYNGGVGGEKAAQIRARMIGDTVRRDWTAIIWAGRNDLGTASIDTVPAEVAAMVASLSHTRYLVIGITPAVGESTGGGTRNAIDAQNAILSAAYGTKFLDLAPSIANSSGLIVANASSSTPGEPHFNDTGHSLGHTAISAKLATLGY